MRILHAFLTVAVVFTLACGGGEPADDQQGTSGEPAAASETAGSGAAAGELTMPDWMQVDRDAETVTMEIVAGSTEANNYWNFQGYASGEAEIVVPAGYSVELTFRNDDSSMAHSLGIDEMQSNWSTMFQDPQPVFEGAITSGPTQIPSATQPGESETISFTASEAGEYAMVCYVPGHAIAGMWIRFTVSADGEAGIREVS